jgi:hypothetical protein
MKLRALSQHGIRRFGEFLDRVVNEPTLPIPYELLESKEASTGISSDVEILPGPFESRFELAEHLVTQFDAAGFTGGGDGASGIWPWISLYWFDMLCPLNKDGKRVPGARARWVPEADNFQRYYRHLVFGPYAVFRAHSRAPQNTRCLLSTIPSKPGEVFEQIVARQEIVTNAVVVAVANRLYWNASAKSLWRGAGGADAGSSRRFVQVLQQFDVTFDLYSMSEDELWELLPKEFDKYKARAKVARA